MKTGPEGPAMSGGRSSPQLRSARGAAVSVLFVDESVLVDELLDGVEVLELSVDDGALMLPEGVVCVSVEVLGEVLGVVLVLLSGVVAGGFVSAAEGAVVWATLMPAAVTRATTPAMLKVLGRFFIYLTPFP